MEKKKVQLTSILPKKKEKESFYRLDNILAQNCLYNMIIGERSNGKTYACIEYALKEYIDNGYQSAYIRRWDEDFKGKRGQQLCSGHSEFIEKYTKGEWTKVSYYSGKWYLARRDDDMDKDVRDEEPFMFAFGLNAMEHDKSTSYPNITTIIFDEFITRQYYLRDEFILFVNVLSTIIRHRDNVKIFMLGNTVNKWCIYFTEMGLKHVPEMDLGKIDVYNYGDSGLSVAVERCRPNSKKGKKSDKYFAFDNPALKMITGGAWEIDIYPHLPEKYNRDKIQYIFFINFNDNLLQCEVVEGKKGLFIYIHNKTTRLQENDYDLIYSAEYSPAINHRRNILKPQLNIEKKISTLIKSEKVFFQDNEIGEVYRNYLMFCRSM